MNASRYDIILIGSGMGALTVASLMAQMRGKKVLVLERHFKAGGYTHSFKRQKYHWDVGIHYVGQMGKGSVMRRLFDLVTQGGVDWQKMPDLFEKFTYPDRTFNLYSNKEGYINDLIEQFPEEESAIRQYFRDTAKAATAFGMQAMSKSSGWLKLFSSVVTLFNPSRLNLTTQTYLDRHFQNPQLKALLASQWGTYGLPPSKSPFAVHSTIVQHYLEGAYYPVGGAGTIASSVQEIVEANGGKFLLNREATEILIEDGNAIGVRVRKMNAKEDTWEEYYAPVIVSNIGAAATYLKLIPNDYPITFRESLRQFVQQHSSIANVTLYVGFSEDPRKLGFKGENHWIYESLNHDDIYNSRGEWIEEGKATHAYISFPSLKDPQAKAHTAEIIAWADYDTFARWREQSWLKRDEEYQALKQRLSQALIDLVEKYYPGFAEIIDYQELSTPLTNEHFTGHDRGGIYGMAIAPERFEPENLAWTNPKTPVPGLYLTGVDLMIMGGIVPAMLGGLLTIANLPQGMSVPQTFIAAGRF
ncbi:MAG: NAD(P)/FAD-dependent oxidoreductase [Hydrococcus sp. Prado102]|jgi:phytoene dehydrogenase-like protein|nr:NAD(P)/FAD-dependent oxidoreductase [Hydrococcus sp. Prado102]